MEDYLDIHEMLDCSKSNEPTIKHRALFHNSLGPYIAARIFGDVITNSAGKLVSVRDICEEHIIEDMGRIPTVADYLDGMPMYDWLGGSKHKGVSQIISFNKINED